MTTLHIRPLDRTDRPWVLDFLRKEWGSPVQAYGGRLHHVDRHPAFVAVMGDERVRLLTYRIDGDECETRSSLRCSWGEQSDDRRAGKRSISFPTR